MRKRGIMSGLAVGALLLSGCSAAGSSEGNGEYPNEQVDLVIAFGPGGTNDLLGRRTATALTEVLGQDVTIENREGGAGAVGTTYAHSQPDDGHTLVTWSPPGELLHNAAGVVDYSPDDFTMIGASNVEPATLAVGEGSEYQTLTDLLDRARSGDRMTVGHVGENTGAGIVASYLMETFGVELEHVPYDSGSEVHAAVMGGHVDFGIRTGGWLDEHGNGINVIGLTSEERLEELPDVPTIEEETGEPVFFSAIRGLAVRSSTDEAIVDTLTEAYEEAATSEAFIDGFAAEVGRYEYLSPEEIEPLLGEQEAVVQSVMGEQP